MKARLEKEILVTPSLCDSTACLGLAHTFALFMDMAAEHAEELDLGSAAMARRNLFWLTVRTRVCFYQRPAMMQRIVAATWPGKPGRVRCARYYTLHQGETLLAEGQTEWAVLNTKTGRIVSAEAVYPFGFVPLEETICREPFVQISADFSAAEEVAQHTVKSTDVDFGGHMNNVAYVRALLGAFSTEALQALAVREMEICFRASCYEGEQLSIRRRTCGAGLELAMLRPEEKPAILARIR